METTGGDASWLNVNNERHYRNFYNMVISVLIDSNQNETNGDVQQRHKKMSIDEKYTVH